MTMETKVKRHLQMNLAIHQSWNLIFPISSHSKGLYKIDAVVNYRN